MRDVKTAHFCPTINLTDLKLTVLQDKEEHRVSDVEKPGVITCLSFLLEEEVKGYTEYKYSCQFILILSINQLIN